MDSESPGSDLPSPAPVTSTPTLAERTVAAIEVVLCSDYPTQFALVQTFLALGFSQQHPDGTLTINFIAAVSIADTILLIGLIVVFLLAHGESPREVFLGSRPVLTEARVGIPLILIAFLIALAVIIAARTIAP